MIRVPVREKDYTQHKRKAKVTCNVRAKRDRVSTMRLISEHSEKDGVEGTSPKLPVVMTSLCKENGHKTVLSKSKYCVKKRVAVEVLR